ncbi:MAG: D-glycero-beta-D-manno-heptose 1,7-bisphosphate 7-phosphatase [Gammaproteobacteria bacterium]|nr:D-glycero-beta-D-manno-heptose 1,7-bisphosphate 7-phosphatase [Gammaproteobacteria bacterium]
MKIVILDRDGVINKESAEFIKTPEEWIPIKGSVEAIARLSQAGFDVVVITNQSGVGRGLISADMLGQIHVRMIDYVQQHGGKIKCVLFCPHVPEDNCACRKPKTGLYDELSGRLNTFFASGIYSVGDSMRDLRAAKAAGATPVLVKTGNGKKTLQQIKSLPNDDYADTPVFDNLNKFVDALLLDAV